MRKPKLTPAIGGNRCVGCGAQEGDRHLPNCTTNKPGSICIKFPNMCYRCGEINPDWFWVRNEQWKKIREVLPLEFIKSDYRDVIICYSCYRKILNAIRQTKRREKCSK